ncbi:unnamed protein product [Cyclocybe aegerita]|uniref:Uncharacterized protein n=1 Tax=Cyclocybe aegerita TaxID=1973307 RepID=A0A8S0VTY3_CYCAE|nr:unnamed protein product [Cyclocybe aegerita]
MSLSLSSPCHPVAILAIALSPSLPSPCHHRRHPVIVTLIVTIIVTLIVTLIVVLIVILIVVLIVALLLSSSLPCPCPRRPILILLIALSLLEEEGWMTGETRSECYMAQV